MSEQVYDVHLVADPIVIRVLAESPEQAVDKAIERANKDETDWSAQDVYS